jgi:hypothetical protein
MPTSTPSGARFALVVDDNPAAAAISGALLEASGWTVEHARDGFEAIVRFRSRNYGAVVLDYQLPGMDGVEVLAWIRRHVANAPSRGGVFRPDGGAAERFGTWRQGNPEQAGLCHRPVPGATAA